MDEIELLPARPDDIERLCALHNRSEMHDGVPRVLEVQELRDELDDERIVLATDVRLAFVDGQLAGYVYTRHLPSDVSQERCFIFGQVDPLWRGRGVGRTHAAVGHRSCDGAATCVDQRPAEVHPRRRVRLHRSGASPVRAVWVSRRFAGSRSCCGR